MSDKKDNVMQIFKMMDDFQLPDNDVHKADIETELLTIRSMITEATVNTVKPCTGQCYTFTVYYINC